jgi:hypothetical protein
MKENFEQIRFFDREDATSNDAPGNSRAVSTLRCLWLAGGVIHRTGKTTSAFCLMRIATVAVRTTAVKLGEISIIHDRRSPLVPETNMHPVQT